MRVRRGWIALAAVISLTAVAACGGPEVTDLGTGSGTPGGTGSPGGSGTPGSGSPTPTGSGSPGAIPTITNVPSYATFISTINKAGVDCSSCHVGGSGGLTTAIGNTDETVLKSAWFTHICNRNSGGNKAGVQQYNPAQGREIDILCNGASHSGGGVGGGCNTVRAWLQTGTATPPLCDDGTNGVIDYIHSH